MSDYTEQQNPKTGEWEKAEHLPLYSNWEVFKDELPIWLKKLFRKGATK